jgi:CubicO group peptidase (beta-lactamase class C family)
VAAIPQTAFCIASITKQFIASAILKLQEEGKLSVDDKLSKYIPGFPRGDEVTLRHLLTHTSGIHNHAPNPDIESVRTNAPGTEAIIEEMKKDAYDFDPGTKWSYDNSGYFLLGYIVEKVSGQSYGDFLRENFFRPLGMTNTGVCRTHPDLPHEALGYGLGTNGFNRALNWDLSWLGGAGALYSTVEDLYRWNEAVFNGRVLKAASLKAAFTPVKIDEDQINSDFGYGFGWQVNRNRGLREIWHNGGVDGFRSYLLRVPDEKFTLTILANAGPGRTNAAPDFLAQQLVEIFLADKLAPLPVINTHVSPKSYDALTGCYKLAGKILTISRRGSHLFGQYADQAEKEIFPESDTEFFSKIGTQAAFVKDSSGKAVKLIVQKSDGIEIGAVRVDIAEVKVDPVVYDRLAGKYGFENGDELTVTREGSHLFAQCTGEPKCEIFPESETDYFWKVAEVKATFVKDAAGKVTKVITHQNGKTFGAPKIQ